MACIPFCNLCKMHNDNFLECLVIFLTHKYKLKGKQMVIKPAIYYSLQRKNCIMILLLHTTWFQRKQGSEALDKKGSQYISCFLHIIKNPMQ